MLKHQESFSSIINSILEKRPDLTAHGLHSGLLVKSEETNVQLRDMLVSHEPQFWLCVDYLQKLRKIRAKSYHSYPLKGEIERATGVYLTNGTLIAAAMYLGLKLKEHSYSPNVDIKVPALPKDGEVQP